MKVTLIDKNTNGINTIIDALNICRDKQCTEKTLTDCLNAKPFPHLSVLEFSWFCFLIEEVSIKTRIQQLRHRTFSTMERSTRHIDMSSYGGVVPAGAGFTDTFEEFYGIIKTLYAEMSETEKLGDAAYILPLGTETKFLLAGNGRVWFEYLQKRLCPEFVQEEHYLFAEEIYRQLVKEIPQFEFANPCLKCGVCRG